MTIEFSDQGISYIKFHTKNNAKIDQGTASSPTLTGLTFKSFDFTKDNELVGFAGTATPTTLFLLSLGTISRTENCP